MGFCTQADLEIALGGAAILTQLADPDRIGSPDEAIVEGFIEDGAAEIRSVFEKKHDPEILDNLDNDSLRLLRNINSKLSARLAYERGGMGQAMPDHIKEAASRADSMCAEIGNGTRRLGRASGGKVAAINQNPGVVNFDEGGHGVSIEGFSRGFR